MAPERLAFVDLVTSSHAHTDHLDADTLRPLSRGGDWTLIAPAAEAQLVAERSQLSSDRIVLMDDGGRVEVNGVQVQAVAAAHETIDRDSEGRCRYLGYVVRWGDWTIYHSGDTVDYAGLAERLSEMKIDVAILPINGRLAERRVAGNLWGDEAARLAQAMAARWVIPCHFEMFEFNTVTTELFCREAERIGQAAVPLRCGQRWTASGR